jgi:cysteine-rich repeat protein
MGEICGNIVGCNTAVLSSSGIITCISCSLNKGFIISSGICICKEYYYLYGSVCKEICGDGYLFVLACDDGNLVDGDGCSSSCSI